MRKCKGCNKEKELNENNFTIRSDNGRFYWKCNICKNKREAENYKNPKIKTTEQFIKEASELHCGKYSYSKSEYIGAHDKVIITCNIHGDFEQTPRNHLFGKGGKGQGCTQCMNISAHDALRLTNEDIDNYLISNNRNIKRLGDYKNNSSTKIKWQCLSCDNMWNTTYGVIKQGCGCPKCNDTKLTNKDIDDHLIENNIEIKRIDNYPANIFIKINWQCLRCGNIWLAQPCEIIRNGHTKKGGGSGCPECARNKNEKIVGGILKQLNILTSRLVINTNNRKYFPDYWAPELNLIIEYNGVQHYRPTQFGSMTISDAEESFNRQKDRDEELRKHCLDNNIRLLEIDGRKYKGEHLKKFVLDYFKNGNMI